MATATDECDCVGCADRREPTSGPPYCVGGASIVIFGACSRCRGTGRLGPGQGVGPKDKCPSHYGCGGSGRVVVKTVFGPRVVIESDDLAEVERRAKDLLATLEQKEQ